MITSLNTISSMLAPHVKKIGYYLVPEITLLPKYERWRRMGKTLLSKEAQTRLEWIIFYETKAKQNASLTSRHFGIAPKTFYKWKNLFNEKDLTTLENRSKAPKHVRQREITPTEETRILKLRRDHLCWGKMKIKKLYTNIYQEEISSWKI